MSYLLALYRFVAFVFITLYYIIKLVLLNIFSVFKLHNAVTIPKQWSQAMLQLLHIEVTISGTIPQGKVVLLPNHRSYIDGVVTCAHFFSSYVMKAEVGKWPLIGWGTKITGTILVNRSNRDSRKETREKVKERLAAGYSVVVFPEGTTYEGPGCLVFKPGMFQVAADGNIPVVPVAIEYEVVSDAWVGNDTFVPHFFRCFSKKKTRVKMHIGEVMQSTDALLLEQKTHNWIYRQLTAMRAAYDREAIPFPLGEQTPIKAVV
jgi:1-acyl-sn-glycerol-3-phosphate acyltransferase